MDVEAAAPGALTLVDMIEDEWRKWRSTTEEGMEIVDVGNERALAGVFGGKKGLWSFEVEGRVWGCYQENMIRADDTFGVFSF